MDHKVLTLVAVRLKSNRLPRKALAELYGEPLIIRLTERVRQAKIPADVIWCTSTHSQDDPLEQLASERSITCFRGSELDVMSRFIQVAVQEAGAVLAGSAQSFVVKTIGVVSRALTVVIGLASLPLFLYYVLKDREKMVDGLVSVFPPSSRTHARNIITLVNHVFSSYVRAQLFLGLVVGVMIFIGLTILDVDFAIILAVAAGVFELVPIIGPWLGAIPGIVVVLATSPDKFFWVLLVYFGVQLLENSLLVPRIQSRALNVHPVMILVVIIVGSEVAGLWGIILGPPLVVAGKEVFQYFAEEWHPAETESTDGAIVNADLAMASEQGGPAAQQASNGQDQLADSSVDADEAELQSSQS